jgi:glycosyltransferase involved in cell wall biosynthesis
VVFTGWIDQPEILALMELANIGLAPYWNHVGFVGNLPNKPIEYMAGGLAVVTCLSGYLHELIAREQCGFYYPAGDAGALARLVEQLSSDRGMLEQASQNARRVFSANFDADIVHAGISKYLESVARSAAV